jgi:hypothetical protein
MSKNYNVKSKKKKVRFPRIELKGKTTKYRLKAAMDKMRANDLLKLKQKPNCREDRELEKATHCIDQIMESEAGCTLDKKFL